MASKIEYVNYLCEQIGGAGTVTYKKMFGEYMVYLHGKPIFIVCDDTVFVKINEVSSALLGEYAEKGAPYNGAKEHFIVTFTDDRPKMEKLASELEKITPQPKPKKKKDNIL